MPTNEQPFPFREQKFLVTCDDCSLSREVEGKAAARQTGEQHSDETMHEVVAIEWPH